MIIEVELFFDLEIKELNKRIGDFYKVKDLIDWFESYVKVNDLLEKRKQWYLDNEYKEFGNKLPSFINLKLDTDLRRDKAVIDWLYSQ